MQETRFRDLFIYLFSYPKDLTIFPFSPGRPGDPGLPLSPYTRNIKVHQFTSSTDHLKKYLQPISLRKWDISFSVLSVLPLVQSLHLCQGNPVFQGVQDHPRENEAVLTLGLDRWWIWFCQKEMKGLYTFSPSVPGGPRSPTSPGWPSGP